MFVRIEALSEDPKTAEEPSVPTLTEDPAKEPKPAEAVPKMESAHNTGQPGQQQTTMQAQPRTRMRLRQRRKSKMRPMEGGGRLVASHKLLTDV